MADHVFAPDEICAAVKNGELATVREWLDNGGDPNALYASSLAPGDPPQQRPLLLIAARWGRASMIHLLLSRGADVDATDNSGRTAVYQVLNHFNAHRSLGALRLLLSKGADVNLALHRTVLNFAGRTPLHNAAGGGHFDGVRMLLRAGADTEHRDRDGRTAEEHARYFNEEVMANLLRDVRIAGGWVRYALQPHYGLLVLRALCHRGRATFRLFSARTPEVLVRLFGAPEAQGRKYTIRGRVDLPDPLFWRVLEFALGPVYDYPWVRERVRARAAAVAAAE